MGLTHSRENMSEICHLSRIATLWSNEELKLLTDLTCQDLYCGLPRVLTSRIQNPLLSAERNIDSREDMFERNIRSRKDTFLRFIYSPEDNVSVGWYRGSVSFPQSKSKSLNWLSERFLEMFWQPARSPWPFITYARATRRLDAQPWFQDCGLNKDFFCMEWTNKHCQHLFVALDFWIHCNIIILNFRVIAWLVLAYCPTDGLATNSCYWAVIYCPIIAVFNEIGKPLLTV